MMNPLAYASSNDRNLAPNKIGFEGLIYAMSKLSYIRLIKPLVVRPLPPVLPIAKVQKWVFMVFPGALEHMDR